MKKMIGVLLGLGLGLTLLVSPAKAQNLVNRYDAYGIGQVNYSLNSGGSSYGQLFNSGSSSLWSLGYGSTQATAGTAVLSWNSSGQVGVGTTAPAASSLLEVGTGNGAAESLRVTTKGILEFHATTAPTVSSCGTSPSVASGSDQAGDVTTGTSLSNSCTITFASAYTNIPHCFCSDRTTKSACIAQATSSTVVLAASSTVAPFVSSDVLDYVCIGHN